MRAAVLVNPKTIEIQNVALPLVKEDEVKIKVQGCGICASSLPLWQGREWFSYPNEPGSPGHEGWGIVEEVGDTVTTVKAGDSVAFLSFHAYADYDVANINSLVVLPGNLQNQPFPGEPLGCAMNIFDRSDISAGDIVAIIGIGFLGALLCQLAKHRGAKVIAISRRPFSLQFAKQFGADELIGMTETWDVYNKVNEITGGNLCSRVIEATGKQQAMDIATEIVSEGGKIIIAGYHQDGLRQVNMQKWNWKGIDVINAHERDERKYITGMQKAIEAVSNGILNPKPLFTDVLSLADINRGFELTETRPDGFMKAIVEL